MKQTIAAPKLERLMQAFLALQAGDDPAAMELEAAEARGEAFGSAGTLEPPTPSARSGGAGRPESEVK